MPLSSLNRLKRPPVNSWPFETTLYFPEGLFGFESYTYYLLIGHEKEVPFLRLQAKMNRDLSFLVVDPFLYYPEYTPTLTKKDVENVGVVHEGKLILLAIVNRQEFPMTMNLSAPLLIHWFKRKGKQLLIHDDPVFPLTT